MGQVSGSTAFGYFDNDIYFKQDAKKFAISAGRRLGYPIVDIQLTSGSFFNCFQIACRQYSNQINMYQIKQNLLNLQGTIIQQDTNYSHTLVVPSLTRVIQLSQAYGTQIGLGKNVKLYKDYIDVQKDVQDYDLTELFISKKDHLKNKHIQIRRVFHYPVPAIVRYFDPWAGSGMGTHTMLDQFGMGSMSPSVQFNVMPIYQDLLRMQAIELNDTIRKSNYSFQLVGNKLRLFPIPLADTKV